MATPHINAEFGDIAKVVLMPGDPKRAKLIADSFLRDVKEVSDVRGIVCYTGKSPRGKRVSVMASGMGQASIGIYSYELFKFYGVEMIIRVGTCGSYQKHIKVKDIIIATTASTDGNWAHQYELEGTYSAGADFIAANVAYVEATKLKKKVYAGNVLSADVFYNDSVEAWKQWEKMGVLAVEMESYALYCNAARLGKKALCILTVSDSFHESELLTSEERQNSLMDMLNIAINTAEKFA